MIEPGSCLRIIPVGECAGSKYALTVRFINGPYDNLIWERTSNTTMSALVNTRVDFLTDTDSCKFIVSGFPKFYSLPSDQNESQYKLSTTKWNIRSIHTTLIRLESSHFSLWKEGIISKRQHPHYTWNDAEQFCKGTGSHLLSIHSIHTVERLIQSVEWYHERSYNYYVMYIGLLLQVGYNRIYYTKMRD